MDMRQKNINLLNKKVKINKLTFWFMSSFIILIIKKKNKISKFIWIILSYFIIILVILYY